MGVSRKPVLLAALTCAAAIAMAGPSVRTGAGGTVTGTITTKEPAMTPIAVTIDPGVCGPSLPNEAIDLDGTGHLANVVVTATGVKASAPAEAPLSNEKCISHTSSRPGEENIDCIENGSPPFRVPLLTMATRGRTACTSTGEFELAWP